MNNGITLWRDVLICPVDKTPFVDDRNGAGISCPTCGFVPALRDVEGRVVPDFRAQNVARGVQMTVFPITPLDRYDLAKTAFRAPDEEFPHYSRREIRRRFGTKLDKGIQYYVQKLLRDHGPDAPILDLGCGKGGTQRYLRASGFRRVLAVDWSAAGAEFLVDAHRLPFDDASFQMVIATAVLEHLYNPFLAMMEIGRVLRDGGSFLGGASFWEAWHGSSYFHLTPDGWHVLLAHAGMRMEDLWPGWGIIPAALTHVLVPGHLRGVGYALQRVVDFGYRVLMGEAGLRRFHLRASGSYQVYATKSSLPKNPRESPRL